MRCIHKGAGYILFLQLFRYFDQDNLIDCQIILEAMNFMITAAPVSTIECHIKFKPNK